MKLPRQLLLPLLSKSIFASAFLPSSFRPFIIKTSIQFSSTETITPRSSSASTIFLTTSRAWETRFEELVYFYQEHGHCNVPRNSGALGNWVQKQRHSYKLHTSSDHSTPSITSYSSPPPPLTDQQVELLDSIGFIWDVHEFKYQNNLDDLKEFYIRHSHIDVPSSIDGEYRTLYKWLCRQKDEYKKYLHGETTKLTTPRRQALESLGFHVGMFDVTKNAKKESKRVSWDGRYRQLLQFKEDHGHCDVPTTIEKYKRLSSWVQHQRAERRKKLNGKKSRLSEEKEALLNDAGFIWSSKEWNWQLRLKDLKMYKELHGHCIVPTKDGGSLGAWVMTQRLQYGKNALSQDRVDALNELGFVWNMHGLAWDDKFNELRNALENSQEISAPLNSWIATQRAEKRYKEDGLQNHLTDERERKLDEIGFDWNANESRQKARKITWARNYEKLRKCIEETGSTKLHLSGQSDGFNIWVRDQRRYLKAYENGLNSPMTKERRDLLVSIGL
jgi:hypothetical protein